MSINNTRIRKEKDFHNKRFASEEDPRKRADKYYSITKRSREYYRSLYVDDCKNRRVLAYGCGTGGDCFLLAEKGANVTGVDISDVAIDRARRNPESRCHNLKFHVMNAEKLDFPDSSFEIIYGSGILHHLDLGKAYSELARVLAPNGKAVFFEPLGHNSFINLYRRLTPALRSEDEHPLLLNDLKKATMFFDYVDVRYFHLTSLLAIPFRGISAFNKILTFLESFDRFLLSVFPFMRRYAWIAVISLSSEQQKKSPHGFSIHQAARLLLALRVSSVRDSYVCAYPNANRFDTEPGRM